MKRKFPLNDMEKMEWIPSVQDIIVKAFTWMVVTRLLRLKHKYRQ